MLRKLPSKEKYPLCADISTLINKHAEYMVTWAGLGLATSIMVFVL
jgi:cytochrome oxidase assembly protein ShyY1